MYTLSKQIIKNSNLEYFEVAHTKTQMHAKIFTSQGCSLQTLTLNQIPLIIDLDPLLYADTYASSILFPFANRIDQGTYSFNTKTYTIPSNEIPNNNALHGLIYNKNFTLKDSILSNDKASLVFEYIETEKHEGFPFTYAILINYIFTEDSTTIQVSVKNTDTNTFPFTIGWHPYFLSDNLYESGLSFNSDTQFTFGERRITKGEMPFNKADFFQIKDQQLDNCFPLKTNAFIFKTPKYHLHFDCTDTNSAQNFLQVYTPPKKNCIAIEPTTGLSNSFNNQIGLQTLSPNCTYTIQWHIKLKTL